MVAGEAAQGKAMCRLHRAGAQYQHRAESGHSEQELELKTNTELTRAIHVLTTGLHRSVIGDPTQ